jgi:hypothetical protein
VTRIPRTKGADIPGLEMGTGVGRRSLLSYSALQSEDATSRALRRRTIVPDVTRAREFMSLQCNNLVFILTLLWSAYGALKSYFHA